MWAQLIMTHQFWPLTVASTSGRQHDGRTLKIKNTSKICLKIKVSLCNVFVLRDGKNGKSTYCTLGTSLCAEVFITVFMTSKTGKQLEVNEHHFLKI